MLSKAKLEELNKRAQNAVNGYAADVNINCYVYGGDMLAMLADRAQLEHELKSLHEVLAALRQTNAAAEPAVEPSSTTEAAPQAILVQPSMNASTVVVQAAEPQPQVQPQSQPQPTSRGTTSGGGGRRR